MCVYRNGIELPYKEDILVAFGSKPAVYVLSGHPATFNRDSCRCDIKTPSFYNFLNDFLFIRTKQSSLTPLILSLQCFLKKPDIFTFFCLAHVWYFLPSFLFSIFHYHFYWAKSFKHKSWRLNKITGSLSFKKQA